MHDLAGTFILYPGRPWKEVIEEVAALVVHVLRKLRKEKLVVLVGVELVRLGCFSDAVSYGACLGSVG